MSAFCSYRALFTLLPGGAAWKGPAPQRSVRRPRKELVAAGVRIAARSPRKRRIGAATRAGHGGATPLAFPRGRNSAGCRGCCSQWHLHVQARQMCVWRGGGRRPGALHAGGARHSYMQRGTGSGGRASVEVLGCRGLLMGGCSFARKGEQCAARLSQRAEKAWGLVRQGIRDRWACWATYCPWLG